MNIEEIKQIVNSDVEESLKDYLIILSIARDKSAIPTIMKILDAERKNNSDLIMDMNLELSRAHIYIDMRPEPKSEYKESFNKKFLLEEIEKFYLKYKNIVNHCFNRFK